jgi:hypothetical protein
MPLYRWTDAARRHDLLVSTGALKIAACSVAEALGIPIDRDGPCGSIGGIGR